jgi:hypothetical protein
MPKQQSAGKQSRSGRDTQQEADRGAGQNGHEEQLARYEEELSDYLQQRIKPGLNSGAIPLLARSIAKEIAHREPPNGGAEDSGAEDGEEPQADAEDESSAEAEDESGAEAEDDSSAEAEDESSAEADDESSAETDEEPTAEAEGEDEVPDFEADMHELQSELGEDWILSFSVQGDDAWLTAVKDDGSQRLEAPTASVLSEAVQLLNEGGGRSS